MSNPSHRQIGWKIPQDNPSSNPSNLESQHYSIANQAPYQPTAPPNAMPGTRQPVSSANLYPSAQSQFDPFAHLPTPIPVPIIKQSQGSRVGGRGNGKPSPKSGRGSHGKHHNESYVGVYNHQPKFPSQSPLQHETRTVSVIRHPSDLDAFGKFELVNNLDVKFQMVTKYINNSHGFKESHGGVQIHGVYQLNSSGWKAYLKNLIKLGKSSSEQMLLWYKTTPKGMEKLISKTDGCVAFYDRLCRAFPEDPNKMHNPLRQIVVLCAVSLGKVHKSPHGFRHWSQTGSVPPGFDTVKGMGKLVPDFGENTDDDNFIVPSGHTKMHGVYKNYELDFNEYIVFDSRRIKVKYAVDMEVFPPSS